MSTLSFLCKSKSNASAHLLQQRKLDLNSLFYFPLARKQVSFYKSQKPRPQEIKMGANSSKDEKKESKDTSVQVNEDSSFHLVEFHLPSASYGVTFLLLLIALAFLLYIAYRRCVVKPRRKRDCLPIWLSQL